MLTPEEIVEKLKAGHELVCRGRGWWLSERQRPYVRSASVEVSDELVTSMVEAGTLKFRELTYSVHAELVE